MKDLTQTINILLIEDSPSDAEIIKDGIERSVIGDLAKIDHADTLRKGVDRLKRGNISIVLLDYHLPDGEGLQALRLIYQTAPEIPILIVTGLENDDVGMLGVQHGAQDYLVKGITPPAALARAIRYSIHRKRIELSYLNAREAAIKSEKYQSTFLATMSHDIRTPLSALLGFLNLARDRNLSTIERDHFLEIAENTGEFLLSLVNDILDISSIKAGAITINAGHFDLYNLCKYTLGLFELKAKQKGVDLKLKYSPSLSHNFFCDSRRLQQILFNLVGNAVKFCSKGEICLTVEESPIVQEGKLFVRFIISDTGIGIREENIEKLFKQFEQIDKSIQSKFAGTGLGLYISQYFAEKMGGKITVRSQFGKGSEFEFTLSADVRELKSLNAKEKQDSKDLQQKKLHILIVEDSFDLAIITQHFLKHEGHTFKTVDNGQKALDILEKEKFDLILMDMQMPIMDGYTATAEIRKRELLSHKKRIPIIALTGDALKEDVAKCLEVGCQFHLSKPAKRQELYKIIQQAVNESDEGLTIN